MRNYHKGGTNDFYEGGTQVVRKWFDASVTSCEETSGPCAFKLDDIRRYAVRKLAADGAASRVTVVVASSAPRVSP